MFQSLQALLLCAAGWLLWTAGSYFLWGRRHRVETAWFIVTALAIAVAAMKSRQGGSAPAKAPARESKGPVLSEHAAVMLLLALALAVILYWPAVGIGLLSDDYVLLARPLGTTLDVFAWEHFRPLPLLVWKAIYPAGGAPALHLLNITLHGLNAWMLWRLSVRLGHAPLVAACAAALFLFFPAAVEAVAWNSGIFDVAAVFFGLLYLHGAIAPTPRSQALGVAALVAAMLSKETAVVLPAIAGAVAVRTRANWRTLAVSIALACGYTMFRLLSGTRLAAAVVSESESGRYAVKEALVRPFATLAVPWTRTELTAWPAGPLALGLLPVAIVVVLIVAYALRPRAALRPLTNAAWVLLGTVPLAGFFFVGDELQGSRYLYLPLCGWSLFLGDLLDRLENRRAGVLIPGVLLAAACGAGFWGVRHHLQSWERAAASRDAILASADRTLLESRCSSATFERVPPVQDEAAQLFRNGFDEAVRGMAFQSDGAACRFVWTGAAFERLK